LSQVELAVVALVVVAVPVVIVHPCLVSHRVAGLVLNFHLVQVLESTTQLQLVRVALEAQA
jgi:hypothetical protein